MIHFPFIVSLASCDATCYVVFGFFFISNLNGTQRSIVVALVMQTNVGTLI